MNGNRRRWLAAIAFTVACTLNPNVHEESAAISTACAAGCNTNDNLTETALSFIGRCCQARVHGQFPGQWYSKTVAEVRKASESGDKSAQTAWKLLNDGRFRNAVPAGGSAPDAPPPRCKAVAVGCLEKEGCPPGIY